MSDEPRRIPPGSREEAQIAESILYGLLWGLLMTNEHLIRERFHYEGAEILNAHEADQAVGVIYDGLRIRMATGSYRVRIERERP